MLVYRADERVVDTLPMLERLILSCDGLERPPHDAVTALFIDLAEFEAGVADRVSPRHDRLSALTTHLRRVRLRSAHALIASWRLAAASGSNYHLGRELSDTFMTSTDPRQAAEESLQTLIASVQSQPENQASEAFLEECAALRVAIRAFHMEGIRFRMYNVDRMITRETVALSPDARAAFGEVRRQLEAAGFHTRSHQAPT